MKTFEEFMDEAKIKRVVRQGKITKKLDCPAGKISKDGKCVVQSATDKRTRKKAAKKAARSKKGKSYTSSKIQQKRSMNKSKKL
jgi:hypothetical protein